MMVLLTWVAAAFALVLSMASIYVAFTTRRRMLRWLVPVAICSIGVAVVLLLLYLNAMQGWTEIGNSLD